MLCLHVNEQQVTNPTVESITCGNSRVYVYIMYLPTIDTCVLYINAYCKYERINYCNTYIVTLTLNSNLRAASDPWCVSLPVVVGRLSFAIVWVHYWQRSNWNLQEIYYFIAAYWFSFMKLFYKWSICK